jgi:hypothetical protein
MLAQLEVKEINSRTFNNFVFPIQGLSRIFKQWRINTHLTGGVQISLGGCIGALPKGHIAITPVL